MPTITQLKKAIKKAEFSKDIKKKIGKILSKAKDGLKEEDKKGLLTAIRVDMARDLMEAEGCRIVLREIDKLFAEAGK